MSNRSLEIAGGLSSKGKSVDEGNVDVELNRADVEELSLPPLDLELFVPPLPLIFISNAISFVTNIAVLPIVEIWAARH